jgi:hypothetical protein
MALQNRTYPALISLTLVRSINRFNNRFNRCLTACWLFLLRQSCARIRPLQSRQDPRGSIQIDAIHQFQLILRFMPHMSGHMPAFSTESEKATVIGRKVAIGVCRHVAASRSIIFSDMPDCISSYFH